MWFQRGRIAAIVHPQLDLPSRVSRAEQCVCENPESKAQWRDLRFTFGVLTHILKPNSLSLLYGPTNQAAQKLKLSKGTAFRPYITNLESVRLQPLRATISPETDFFRCL
jgi:hypothetical protein